MKRLFLSVLTAVFLLLGSYSATASGWADHFPGPEIICPGTSSAPGPVLDTLTPELNYRGVGAVTYVYIFDTQDTGLTRDEQLSNHPRPVLMSRASSTSLHVPVGVLVPGHNYYWYVESIHAPGTRSEAVKISSKLYFSTASDEK